MPEVTAVSPLSLSSASGLKLEINANGSLRRFDCNAVSLLLFPGNEMEGGPANLYLRRRGKNPEWTPLLGPRSPTRLHIAPDKLSLTGTGLWRDLRYTMVLALAETQPAWFWHVQVENSSGAALQVDLTYVQDLALSAYGAVRMNEFYVSQYIDHAPLQHPEHGTVVASRQNQAVDGRYPWSLIGSLRTATSFATDARQFHGFASRAGDAPPGLTGELPGKRLQHEHSMVVLRDRPLELAAGSGATTGFFGLFVSDHPDATSPADVKRLEAVLSLPEARFPGAAKKAAHDGSKVVSLFACAPLLQSADLDAATLRDLWGTQRQHEEVAESGELLSFFHGPEHHVVMRAKELQVQRPHGHLLRTGHHLTPDETGLTSTTWMTGVFHSMLTQGHVSINRFLSTVRTYLGLYRSQGQRVFVEVGGRWQLLDLPSAYEMSPAGCRWIYRHAHGLIQVRAEACSDPQELRLSMEIGAGEPARFLISHHIALNGDDGNATGAPVWKQDGAEIRLSAPPGSEVGQRFPHGSFTIAPLPGTTFEQCGTDEILFSDGRSRQQPFLCIVTGRASRAGLRIRGALLTQSEPRPLYAKSDADLVPRIAVTAAQTGPAAQAAMRLASIVPWYAHNALVHYLSPRGLEQYSGGGWGTRDVCQGPVEMLLALGRTEPIRDLLLRVMTQQNPDGDWPQWFMFFVRERNIRPGDSHGDIVFWPLLVLAQYLVASGDDSLLDEQVHFFDASSPDAGERTSVWQHVERALQLIEQRVVPGTALAAYGHGDWNDSLQPADPRMREHMCSAWTVTLHFQTLRALAHALRSLGRDAAARRLESSAEGVRRDFQRLLVVDGVLTGYAIFENGQPRCLLHPSDRTTGVKYSSLAMIHAILEDLLTPEQARAHLGLIEKHLSASDGVRLFDRPLPYHGGPQRLFQRAESATFFGREIGLMYTHAHLRYAQALAHMGEAERFFRALCQANPIGILSVVPTATLRQANCYYSSSDAAFADRYQASEEYERVRQGGIALDGGWRVYSSGAGIALGLIVRRFLGISMEADAVRIDPVIPAALDGLKVATLWMERPLEIRYRIGAAGCGVQEILLNDRPIAFAVEANPHRRGAALLKGADLLGQMAAKENALTVRIA